MSLCPPPTVKHADQESGGEFIVRNFRFGPFFAVKICEQCLQIVSTSGDFRATDSLGYSPQMKIPGGATKCRRILRNPALIPENHFTWESPPKKHPKMGVSRHFQASWATQPVGRLLFIADVFICANAIIVLRIDTESRTATVQIPSNEQLSSVHTCNNVEATKLPVSQSCPWVQFIQPNPTHQTNDPTIAMWKLWTYDPTQPTTQPNSIQPNNKPSGTRKTMLGILSRRNIMAVK